MCRLRNIAMRDYQESVTIGQTDTHTHTQTDARQSDPYVLLCFAGDNNYVYMYFRDINRIHKRTTKKIYRLSTQRHKNKSTQIHPDLWK